MAYCCWKVTMVAVILYSGIYLLVYRNNTLQMPRAHCIEMRGTACTAFAIAGRLLSARCSWHLTNP